jgi:hypothetical protein
MVPDVSLRLANDTGAAVTGGALLDLLDRNGGQVR